MSYTGRYAKLKKSDMKITDAGYLTAYVTPLSYLTLIQEPVYADPDAPEIGEAYTIGTSHTYAVGKGSIPCYIDEDTMEAPGETTGGKGSLRFKWKPKIVFPGDGAEQLEQIQNLMNEPCLIHFQNSCENPVLVQFGCDCSPVTAEKASFTSGTIEGTDIVGYTVEYVSRCKYFYEGSITELP